MREGDIRDMSMSSNAEVQTGAYPSLSRELPPKAQEDSQRTDGIGDVLDYYFKRIDPKVADSFTKEQRKALRSILARRRIARHAVEVRRFLRFGHNRYYFLLLAGRERRAYEGVLSKDKAKRSSFHARSLVAGLLAGVALAVALNHFVGLAIVP